MTKEVFERLIQEYTDLTLKLQKLHEFVTNEEEMKNLDNLNQDLLIAQMNAMSAYSSILRIRAGINGKPEFTSDEAEKATEEVKESESE